MPFIHPAIFWTGLAAVSLPILIHLLNRRRFRVRQWAAMKFLLDSVRRNRRRLQIEELILLAVRCLILLLLAASVARFTGCAAMDVLPVGDSARRTVVYVLDDSYSMGQKYGAGTVIAAAKSDLARRVGELGQADTVSIVLTSRPEAAKALFGPAFITDAESLQSRIRSLRPSDKRTGLLEAMDAAGKIFAETPGGERRLYVLSDFRRADLTAEADRQALARQFADLRAAGVQVVTLDYGAEDRGNLTVESVELLDDFAVANIPMRIGITVRNHGQRRAENVEVQLRQRVNVEGAYTNITLPAEVLDAVEPGQTRRLEAVITCRQPGSVVLSAELPADELPGDNRAGLALQVRKALRALLVDGRPDPARRKRSESFFLALALDPSGDGDSGVRSEVISAEQLQAMNLYDYDLIMLLDVPVLEYTPDGEDQPTVLSGLEQYVRDGGGLVIFTGEQTDLTFYNGPLYKGGVGLSPYRIRAPKGDAVRRGEFFRLSPDGIEAEGPMRLFAGSGADLTSLVRFFAFTPAEVGPPVRRDPAVGPPRVLARFADEQQSPALAARSFGQGLVCMIYTSASTRWTDWPQDQPRGIYTAPMQDLVRYVARRQKERFSATVGEPVAYEVSPSLMDASAVLEPPTFPAEAEVNLPQETEGARRLVRYDRTDRAGVYSLQFRMPGRQEALAQVLFQRNPDPAEGALAPAGREGVEAAFGSDDFLYIRRAGQAGAAAAAEPGKEYWLYFLGAMIALLALETYLAQRFGHYT